jgi:transposase InsO family protein
LKAAVQAVEQPLRLTRILDALGSRAPWYRRAGSDPADRPKPGDPPARRGPPAQDIPTWERHVVLTVAQAFPWYGYKKIALICQRLDEPVPRRRVYRILKEAGLLHRLKARIAERARQEVAKLYQLLPKRPNELWQTDVTYIRIPGYGWWYAITVIDYYSRYLLALHLTPSYSASEASHALRQAVAEAQRVHGPLTRPVFLVTDNGPSFIARRFQATLAGIELAGLGVSAFSQVRIAYRTPAQLGLLERFHETLKYEEVYWHLYDDPADARVKLAAYHERYNVARPHWALVAANPATAPARILTPCEVYVKGYAVDPPSWSRWVGWLDEQDQAQAAQPPNRTASKISA